MDRDAANYPGRRSIRFTIVYRIIRPSRGSLPSKMTVAPSVARSSVPGGAQPAHDHHALGASARSCRSISRRHGEVVEVHVAVGLGPQADSSRNRLGQDMLQVKLAVEI